MAELERRVMEKMARADIIEAQRQSIDKEMQRARKDIATQEAWLKARIVPSPSSEPPILSSSPPRHKNLQSCHLPLPVFSTSTDVQQISTSTVSSGPWNADGT